MQNITMTKNEISTKGEVLVLIFILTLFLGLSFSLAPMCLPSPDEPGYTDPAASWALGQGFHSGAWYAQNNEEFFAGNVPLHHITLSYWFRLFGFSAGSSRFHNFFLVVLAAIFLWDGLRRSRIFPAGWRLFVISVVVLSESAFYMSLTGRPDAITCCIASATFWSMTLRSDALRFPLLVLAGALAPWAGIQLAAASAFVFGALFLVLRLRVWREVLAFASGGIAGTLALFVFYDINGVLPQFLASVFPHAGARNFSIYRFTGFWSDRSLLILWLTSLFCIGVAFQKRSSSPDGFRLALALAVSVFGLPLFLVAVGKFSSAYTWMPTWLGVPIVARWLVFGTENRLVRVTLGFLVAASAIAGGYPRLVMKLYANHGDRPLEQMERLAASVIRPGDCIAYSAPAFYSVKPRAREAYYVNWYLNPMSSEDRAQLNLAIIEPHLLPWIQKATGTEWQEVGKPETLKVRRFMRDAKDLEIVAYRRVETRNNLLPHQ